MTTSEAVAEAPAQTQVPTPTATSLTIEDAVKDLMKISSVGSLQKVSVQDVRIYSTHVEVEIKGIKKAISLIDFKQMIDNQLQIETKMEPLALPEGCYLIAKSATEMQVASYYPERKLTLKHNTETYKDCVMPNVIITHKMRNDNGNWLVQDTRYFATDKKLAQLPENQFIWEVNAREHIWLMPFPNFYNEGRMCYGGNTMPVKYSNNLRGLKYFYDVISVSPFNNDLGLHVSWDGTYGEWFKQLTTLEKFDYSRMRSR